MRRDAARLARTIARTGDTGEWAALRRWFDRFEATIEHHHEREDTVVWPELSARRPDFATHLPQLEEDHQELDRAMASVRAALLAEDPAAGIDAADGLDGLLHDHLGREEAAAFPVLAESYAAEDWAQVEQRLQQGTSFRHLAFEVPWALDGIEPARLAELLATLPLPLRFLHRAWWGPAYRRVAAPLAEVAR
jgi:hypothetical protein